MAAGAVLLLMTRPYEGLLLCLPVVIGLLLWIRKTEGKKREIVQGVSAGLILLLAGIAWMAYYDVRAFGNPLTLPYTVNRATYAIAPYYVWQKPRPEPAYNHAEMRRFYVVDELKDYDRVHSWTGLPGMTLVKALRAILFFSGMAFIPALVMLPRALRDRSIRFPIVCLIVLACGMGIEIFLFPHYIAPFAAVFYVVGVQCLRHLWQFRPGGRRAGATLVRLIAVICILMAGLRVFDRQLHCPVPGYPLSTWICNWFGPDHFVSERDKVAATLAQGPGGQLAIVRYAPEHDPVDEWVYNGAEIDAAKIIWARDMDHGRNDELISYYKDRKVWLIQPDSPESEIRPYPVPRQVTAASSR
jgi:hypothetical protein